MSKLKKAKEKEMKIKKLFLMVAVLFLFYNIAYAAGTIQGTVTLSGGSGDDTEVTINVSGYDPVSPDENGNYSIEVNAGT